MKQVSVSLSTYTADVSGVCSALYELGGMVVIHDPSGCNSTYNTHDEPRWYDMDSLVFISGLSQMDAIMGNDEKLIQDILRAAEELSPRFIALVRTPIPLMTGTDFEAAARIIEQETGIPVWYFPTTGMRSYVSGAGMALAAVAENLTETMPETMPENIQTEKNSGIRLNILGATPLDFSVNTTLASLRSLLEKRYQIISTFAMGSTPDEIKQAGKAQVNLVVSSVGMEAARVLRRRFGTPYVIGMPMEGMETLVEEKLLAASTSRKCGTLYQKKPPRSMEESVNTRSDGKEEYIIGEAVISQSLREAFWKKYGRWARVICPLEAEKEFLGKDVILTESEEEIKEVLAQAGSVIADPIYRSVCPPDADFLPLPHEAFSGRIYRKQIPDFLHIFSELFSKEPSEEKKTENSLQSRENILY